jgi:hypothetical protein
MFVCLRVCDRVLLQQSCDEVRRLRLSTPPVRQRWREGTDGRTVIMTISTVYSPQIYPICPGANDIYYLSLLKYDSALRRDG